MVYEFAIDPAVLTTWGAFRELVGGCSVSQGRLLSLFPKQRWCRMVVHACETCESRTELDFSRVVERVNDKLYMAQHSWPNARGRNYDLNKEWLTNAVEQHTLVPFNAIVSVANPEKDSAVLVYDKMSDTDRRWYVKRQKKVRRHAADIATCLGPLLEIAEHVKFVDPHFRPDAPRYVRPLREMLRLLAPGAVAEYHSEVLPGYADSYFERRCQSFAKDFLHLGGLAFYRWTTEKELHERFLLTDKGGVSIDPGLSEDANTLQKASVKLLEDDVFIDQWHTLQVDPRPQRLAQAVICVRPTPVAATR